MVSLLKMFLATEQAWLGKYKVLLLFELITILLDEQP